MQLFTGPTADCFSKQWSWSQATPPSTIHHPSYVLHLIFLCCVVKSQCGCQAYKPTITAVIPGDTMGLGVWYQQEWCAGVCLPGPSSTCARLVFIFFESRLEWILNSIAVIWGSGSCAKQNEAAWWLQIFSWWQALFPDMAMDPGYKLHMVLCSVLCLCNVSQSPLNLARLETVQTQDGEEKQQSCTPCDINTLNMLLKILPSHLRSKIAHLEKRTKLSSPTVLTKCTFFVCLQMILRWKRIASHWRESSSGLFEKSDHDSPGKKAVEQGWENSDHFIVLVVSGWSCVWWTGEAPRWQTACKSLIKHSEW